MSDVPTERNSPLAITFPLRLGDAADYTAIRLWLSAAGFDETTICRVLAIDELADLRSSSPETADRNADGLLLPLLIRLFLYSVSLPHALVVDHIRPEMLAKLQALDLLRSGTFAREQERGDWVSAPVLLYPVAGLLIASDRHDNPDGSPFVAPPDIVFPAIFAGTLRFLRLLPAGPMKAALDLCSGTGVAALALARSADRAVAADITPRATHFAAFNRLLNGCPNVAVVQGDLFAPLGEQTFDRIVAHPPYVPALDDTMIYRDAGETGESIIRRCVEGLSQYLGRGGMFFSLCAGWDTDMGTFEARAWRWLGDAAGEFDILFAVGSEKSPRDFVKEWAEHRDDAERNDIGRWDTLFARMGARRQVYGALVIRRRPASAGADMAERPVGTARYRLSADTDAASFEWMFRWHDWTAAQRAAGALSGAIGGLHVRLPSSMHIRVTHTVADGKLVPTDFVIESSRPFLAATRVDPWMATLLNHFDGERPARAVYDGERAAGRLPASFDPDNFADLIERFIERGYLEIAAPTGIP